MSDVATYLPIVWALVIALAVGIYVVLDGFDLGLGILFPTTHDEAYRDQMMNSVAPFWDGNETWLVLGGGGLWVGFPMAYAIIMPAMYVPVIVMLLALIFRGIAFEFRWASKPRHRAWDVAFAGGSIVAAFAQGTILGSLVQGIKVADHSFAGGPLDWLTPFSALCGFGLVAFYALLGTGWIMMKIGGPLCDHARRLGLPLLGLVAAFAAAVSLWTPLANERVAERWFSGLHLLFLWPLPAATAALFYLAWRAIRTGGEIAPFFATVGIFLLCYLGLAISNYPYLVVPSVSVWDAAASVNTQVFTLIGVLVMVPINLAYSAFVYWTFRGKLAPGEGYH